MADLWHGRQWRMVSGPNDLETGTRKCRHPARTALKWAIPGGWMGTLPEAGA